MSFKRNFSAIFAAAAGSVIFAGAAMAQDTTTAAPNTGDKIERRHERGGEHGDRKFGRGEFGGRHGGFGRGGFGMRGGIFRDLNLTDAQKEQIKQIREANKPNKANFEAMHAIMKAKHDGTITAEQEAQLKAFHEDRMAKMKAVHEQMMNVLTPEQKATLEQKKAEMRQKREEFKKNREQRRLERQNSTTTEKPKVN